MPPLSESSYCLNSAQTNRRASKKFHELKAVVEKAIQNHKTFTVLGPFSCVKNALKSRGWIEKFESKPKFDEKQEKSVSIDYCNKENVQDDDDTLMNLQLSRLLRDYCVDFVWTMKNEPIKWKKLDSKTLISRFPRAEFTTKAGLCLSLKQPYWFYEEGVSGTLIPRCYNISNEDELSDFVDNFKLTACISFVRLISENFSQIESVFQKDGSIPMSSINFALLRCKEYVSQQQHVDVDQIQREKVWDHQWDQFLTNYYKIVHDNQQFHLEDTDNLNVIKEECQDLLQRFEAYWPQFHLDGVNNLWILKPAAKSRGRGILIMKKLEDIISKLSTQHAKENRYVIQKYIERPLLIYNTKFDIRQWFLVTCVYPLTIWMYKESYLRFCSQIYSLVNTHESVHLSNNAVQCKYKNGIRDRNLPDENMWDCYTFQAYLRSQGRPEVWETIIYPGMRQNIIGALLASQDTMDNRKNCFELFGADFMLSETFEPWLIEINSGPSMSSSTSVTARMCAQVMDDVIRVVVDRKNDRNADTGMFELVYRQFIPPAQPYMGQNLIVRGTKVVNTKTKIGKKSLTTARQTRNSSTTSLTLGKRSAGMFYVGGIRSGHRKIVGKNGEKQGKFNSKKTEIERKFNNLKIHNYTHSQEEIISVDNEIATEENKLDDSPATTANWKGILQSLKSFQINSEEIVDKLNDIKMEETEKLPYVKGVERKLSPFHMRIKNKDTNTLPQIVVQSG